MHSVKALKALFTVLFLAMWLPAANCCLLQNLGFFNQDDCCASSESQKPACDETCSLSVAHSQNNTSNLQPVFIVAVLALTAELPMVEKPAAPFPRSDHAEVLKPWHFKERAALPARAPSFVS